jgi:hypothetical protein
MLARLRRAALSCGLVGRRESSLQYQRFENLVELQGKPLGRPITAGLHASEIRKLDRAGIAKAKIARRLQIGRTSVRRIRPPNAPPWCGCRCSNLFH